MTSEMIGLGIEACPVVWSNDRCRHGVFPVEGDE